MKVCITNDVPDLRSCTYKGRHASRCDGWARRYDRDTGQTRILDTPCGGCLPRPATTGFLCESHAEKFAQAVEFDDTRRRVLVDLVTHTWSIESSGIRDDNDRVASAYGSAWPLSESRIAANAIYTELAATTVAFANDLRIPEPEFSAAASILDGFMHDLEVDFVGILIGDLVEWAEENDRALNRRHSAEQAVRLIGVVQTTLARFPLIDSDHHVPYVRCPSCSRMALTWKPPLYYEDEVVIRCEKCGHVTDQAYIEAYVRAVKTDSRRLA